MSFKIKPVKEYLFAKFENLFIATLSGLNDTCFKASKHEHDFFSVKFILKQDTRKKIFFGFPLT